MSHRIATQPQLARLAAPLLFAAALFAVFASATSAAPIANWRFDETSGTIVNEFYGATEGDNGAAAGTMGTTGPAAIDQPGQIDRAYSFNPSGTGDVVGTNLTSVIPASSDFTALMWINTTQDTSTNAAYLFNNYVAGDPGRSALQVTNGNLSFFIESFNLTGGSVDDGDWHHVGVTRSGSDFQLFVDGAASGMLDTSALAIATGTREWVFGRRVADNDRDYIGLIDDAAIWDVALSVDQINSVYSRGLDGISASVVPEPSTGALLLLAAAGIGLARRRSPRAAKAACLSLAGLALAMGPGSSAAEAAIIARDNFNTYAPGELDGQPAGGAGWAGAWQVSATDREEIVTPGSPLADGNAVRITGDAGGNNNPIRRQLASAQTGDIYFRYRFRVEAQDDADDFMQFWLDSAELTDSDTHGNAARVEWQGEDDYFARVDGVASAGTIQAGDVEIVGRLFQDGGSVYDTLQLWIDPSFDDVANETNIDGVAFNGGSSLSTVEWVGFRNGSSTAPTAQFLVDSLVLATTAESLFAIPEPSSLLLCSLGVSLLGLRRKRRQS